MSSFCRYFLKLLPRFFALFQVSVIAKFSEQLFSRIHVNDYICNCKFDSYLHRTSSPFAACNNCEDRFRHEAYTWEEFIHGNTSQPGL